MDETKTKWSGADWIKSNLKYVKPEMVVSDFGEKVADFLGELFYGIYHLDDKSLWRVDWSNTRYIEMSFYSGGLSTFDFDELTRLVFLAHHYCIRVSVKPCNFNYLRLVFHPRERNADLYHRHPSLDEAVANFKERVSLAEV